MRFLLKCDDIKISMLDAQKIKADFPIFKNNPELVYLDSTATSLKPQSVIDAITDYYSKYSANVFRGIYQLSEKATEEYQKSRSKVARFIGAETDEVIFVRNATEGFNLVAYGWGEKHIGKGDAVAVTLMEHHSNFVPWQQLAFKKGGTFVVLPVTSEGLFDLQEIEKLTKKTKLLAITYVSNVLGTINPISEIVKRAKRQNPEIIVVVDAAQAVPHMKVDVRALGCDFVAFSGHKMLGPTGIGVLWGKKELLTEMNPFNYGGEMISEVHVDKTYFKEPPHKFEAGTPHIAGAIGLGAAVEYLENLEMDKVRIHEEEITSYALSQLKKLNYIHPIGPKKSSHKAGIIAFTVERIHAHDVSQFLDSMHIATRSGHHCAMPLHVSMNTPATCRASFYVYTTKKDVNTLVNGLEKVHNYFK